ncbi:alpha-amylase family glycosyl hydrolase [Coraliomargarita sp. W4R53]
MSAHKPAWLAQSVIYQIFPPSFQDSNGDGIGDLRGIESRLDYIQSIGFNVVWLSPIFESPFEDAGYDVSDYYKIAPRYGAMEDFESLVSALHERGMKLLLDFVPGHTSNQHPWFKESAKHVHNDFSHRYVWTDTTFPVDFNEPQTFVNGLGERDGNYMANFFYFQPALNYGYADPDPKKPWQLSTEHPSVLALREEMNRVLRFWLDKGVDGFRVDMASSLIKGNDRKHVQAKMVEFWQEIRSWWDRDYPEALLVAEWSDPSKAVETGFHLDFMIHFNEASYMKIFRGEDALTMFAKGDVSYFNPSAAGELQSFLGELQQHLGYIGDRGYVSIPTGNHDLPRYSIGRSEAELKAILSFILTLPSVPTIYYGDEIGLRNLENVPSKEGAYIRTGARSPMQWDNQVGAGFSTAVEGDFYLPLNPPADRPNVEEHLQRSDSLLNHVKQLLQLRQAHSALGVDSSIRQLNSPESPYPVVYLRQDEQVSFLVAVNALPREVEAKIQLDATLGAPVFGHATITKENGIHRLQLSAYECVIVPVE